MKLEDLNVYNLSMELGEVIWNLVEKWSYFEKDTIGKQLVRAVDSIAANIAEGYGRFHYKENKQFCFFSRGSLLETKTWISKAKNRNIINEETFTSLINKVDTIGIKLNNYINSIGKTKDDK